MENSIIYYGGTFLEEKDLVETNIKNRVELEYYGTKENKNNILKEMTSKYGIEIVKKEYNAEEIKLERNHVENISRRAGKVIKIIETLKINKVTPAGLQDVLDDLLKRKVF